MNVSMGCVEWPTVKIEGRAFIGRACFDAIEFGLLSAPRQLTYAPIEDS
jgi:hypothetical protein